MCRAMGSVGSSAEHRRPLPGYVLLCQPCGGHPLLVRKSSVSFVPSSVCLLCDCPVRRADRGVRCGAPRARVPISLTRVAGHAQRCGQDGATLRGCVRGGQGKGGRVESSAGIARAACERCTGGIWRRVSAVRPSHFSSARQPSRSVAWGGGGCGVFSQFTLSFAQ